MIDYDADTATMFDTDEHAREATYTPSGGAAVTCHVFLDLGLEVEVGESGAIVNEDRITFRRADVDRPARNAVVVIGSDTYLVDEIRERTDATVSVRVTKQ